MTGQEFHQSLYDSITQRFKALDENWQTFMDTPIKQIQEGGVDTELAVVGLARAVEMLGLRIQYVQSTITALAGGHIVKDDVFSKSRPDGKLEFPDRGLKKWGY